MKSSYIFILYVSILQKTEYNMAACGQKFYLWVFNSSWTLKDKISYPHTAMYYHLLNVPIEWSALKPKQTNYFPIRQLSQYQTVVKPKPKLKPRI